MFQRLLLTGGKGSDATKDVFSFDVDKEQKFSFGSFPYK
jgi:hypothetical protein